GEIGGSNAEGGDDAYGSTARTPQSPLPIVGPLSCVPRRQERLLGRVGIGEAGIQSIGGAAAAEARHRLQCPQASSLPEFLPAEPMPNINYTVPRQDPQHSSPLHIPDALPAWQTGTTSIKRFGSDVNRKLISACNRREPWRHLDLRRGLDLKPRL